MPVVPFPQASFTKSDLEFLYSLWPRGHLVRGRDGDTFIAVGKGQLSWLRISRSKTGAYSSHSASGRIYAEGNALADLSLDGVTSQA